MSSFLLFWIEKNADGNWIRPDTGEVQPSPNLFGPGAVYDAPWLRGSNWKGTPEQSLMKSYPDGLTIVIVTPDGPWIVDGPSYDGKMHHPCGWTRTGDPRNPSTLSVSPSINFPGRYHGWARNGRLEDA